MKKRMILLICALVLLVGCLAMFASAASNKTGYCEACGENVTWEPIVFGTQTGEVGTHKHYYLDQDYNHTSNMQLNVKGNSMTLCVDLNGKSWYSWGRAFYANYNTKNEDFSTINIQDSVGGAVVTSRAEAWPKDDGTMTGTNNTGGANIWIAEKCTVNIYGGTFKLDAIESEHGLRVDNGGIASVCSGGTLNLYGGTLEGGKIKKSGGAVYLYGGGTLNVRGGSIRSGNSADNTGNCVGLAKTNVNSIVRLSGGQIDEIYFPELKLAQLVVDGDFTGSANLAYASGLGVSVGTTVGTLQGGSVANGDLFCTNGSGYSVVAEGTSLNLAAPSAEEVRHECPHCGTVVLWDAFPNEAPSAAGSYHYYLARNFEASVAKQFTVKEGIRVCLDLYGKSFSTTGRALGTSGTGAVLNVMDTVGGGSVNATAASNNPGGGCVSVGPSTTMNIYSGTLTFTHDPSGKWGGTGRGGVIQASGALNIYGGKIVGGEVVDCTYEFTGIEGAGGAIFASSALNIQGGEIISGIAPETGAGPCIYVNGSTVPVTLGGDAKVEDIYFSGLNSAQLSVDADFTGTANLTYPPSQTLHQGLVVGTCTATDWQGLISCTGSFPTVLPVEGNLVLSAYPFGTVAATGGEGYTSLQAAIDAAQEGALVDMMKTCSDDITVNKNIALQLNGCSINGTVTVAEGCTLYGMDSATADFSVSDGKYGKIAAINGSYAGVTVDGGNSQDAYLAIEEAGEVSFHCVRLQIYAMTLRVDTTDDKQEPGLFYKSHFKADEKAAPLVSTYGVALSIAGEPVAENMDTACCYTELTGFESGALGNLGNTSSTLLTGILKERYSDSRNLSNVSLPIYGRAYAKTTDGQILFGSTVCRSLQQQLEDIDQMIPSLSEVQATAVVKMYNKFQSALSQFQLPGIVEAVETEEEGTLKVLVLGNSHGLDATNLLYEVFHNEAPEQKVVIAALYYSGCNMDQHHDFLTNNKKVYTYHKNDGSQPNRTWVVKDSTCLEALQDEQWDIIFMQQMNHRVAIDSNYDNSWQVVANYLMNNQDIAPKLGFHVTWTNPDNYELYLNDDAPLNNPSPGSWRTTHERYWSTDGKYDQSKQYLDIMRCVRQYLVDDTSLLGRPYDMILPVATAIEYAQDVCGRPQTEIYRDYTHMNDYGRLITAYTWYAKIMELDQITEVKMDAIPAVLKHRNSQYPAADANGIYTVDAQMKADLIASVNWALQNPFCLPED